MKPKRVYAYFVEGKKGTKIVLIHQPKLIGKPWWGYLPPDFCSMGLRIIYEYPIADFLPSIAGDSALSK